MPGWEEGFDQLTGSGDTEPTGTATNTSRPASSWEAGFNELTSGRGGSQYGQQQQTEKAYELRKRARPPWEEAADVGKQYESAKSWLGWLGSTDKPVWEKAADVGGKAFEGLTWPEREIAPLAWSKLGEARETDPERQKLAREDPYKYWEHMGEAGWQDFPFNIPVTKGIAEAAVNPINYAGIPGVNKALKAIPLAGRVLAPAEQALSRGLGLPIELPLRAAGKALGATPLGKLSKHSELRQFETDASDAVQKWQQAGKTYDDLGSVAKGDVGPLADLDDATANFVRQYARDIEGYTKNVTNDVAALAKMKETWAALHPQEAQRIAAAKSQPEIEQLASEFGTHSEKAKVARLFREHGDVLTNPDDLNGVVAQLRRNKQQDLGIKGKSIVAGMADNATSLLKDAWLPLSVAYHTANFLDNMAKAAIMGVRPTGGKHVAELAAEKGLPMPSDVGGGWTSATKGERASVLQKMPILGGAIKKGWQTGEWIERFWRTAAWYKGANQYLAQRSPAFFQSLEKHMVSSGVDPAIAKAIGAELRQKGAYKADEIAKAFSRFEQPGVAIPLSVVGPENNVDSEALRQLAAKLGAVDMADPRLPQAVRAIVEEAKAAISAEARAIKGLPDTPTGWNQWQSAKMNSVYEAFANMDNPEQAWQMVTAIVKARQMVDALSTVARENIKQAMDTPAPNWQQFWDERNRGAMDILNALDDLVKNLPQPRVSGGEYVDKPWAMGQVENAIGRAQRTVQAEVARTAQKVESLYAQIDKAKALYKKRTGQEMKPWNPTRRVKELEAKVDTAYESAHKRQRQQWHIAASRIKSALEGGLEAKLGPEGRLVFTNPEARSAALDGVTTLFQRAESGGDDIAKGKVSAKTGFTKGQEQYLAGKLEEVAPGLPEQLTLEQRMAAYPRQHAPDSGVDEWMKKPLPTIPPDMPAATIKVPGDGTVTVRSQQQANNLHKILTGKDIGVGAPLLKSPMDAIKDQVKQVKFAKTTVNVTDSGGGVRAVPGHEAKGLFVHRELSEIGEPGADVYRVTHAASGKALGPGYRNMSEAKIAAARLAPIRDWTLPEAELLKTFDDALKRAISELPKDPYTPFPEGLVRPPEIPVQTLPRKDYARAKGYDVPEDKPEPPMVDESSPIAAMTTQDRATLLNEQKNAVSKQLVETSTVYERLRFSDPEGAAFYKRRADELERRLNSILQGNLEEPAPATGQKVPVKKGEVVEQQPGVTSTISDYLAGRRSARVGTLVVDGKERLAMTLQPDTSEMGTYSIIVSNPAAPNQRSRTYRMKYGGGKDLDESLRDFEKYMNMDSDIRYRVERVDIAPKPVPEPKQRTQIDEWKAELKALEAKKYKNRGQEMQIDRLKRKIALNPSKFVEGQGVGWRLPGQVNRGYRIIEVYPEKQQALIRSVSDTGITVTGGDYDKLRDEVVDMIDLLRDKKYDRIAPTPEPEPALGTTMPVLARDDIRAGDFVQSRGDKAIAPIKGKVIKANPKTLVLETSYMGKPMSVTVRRDELRGEVRIKRGDVIHSTEEGVPASAPEVGPTPETSKAPEQPSQAGPQAGSEQADIAKATARNTLRKELITKKGGPEVGQALANARPYDDLLLEAAIERLAYYTRPELRTDKQFANVRTRLRAYIKAAESKVVKPKPVETTPAAPTPEPIVPESPAIKPELAAEATPAPGLVKPGLTAPEPIKAEGDLVKQGAREPWEMSYREFADLFEDTYNGNQHVFAARVGKPMGIEGQGGEPWRLGTKFAQEGNLHRDRWRRAIVEKALSENKPVPESVLADYPDLAAKYAKGEQATTTPPTTASPEPLAATKPADAVEVPAKAPEMDVQGSAEPMPIYSASRFRSDLSTIFRLDEAQADAVYRLTEARARALGESLDDYLGRRVAGMQQGGVTGEGALQQPVPIDIARQIPVETQLPDAPEFLDAVKHTKDAEVTEDGLRIRLVRYQKPIQGGEVSGRTGVFYLPASDPNVKHYRTAKNVYGGTEKVEGETLIRRPLAVKGATGGKAPEAAYDQLKGKGASERMRNDALKVIGYRTDRSGQYGAAEAFLQKYGDTNMLDEIMGISHQGNQLPYMLQEHAVAVAAREAGYDAIIGYSKRRDGAHFISEVFDLREADFPTAEGYYRLHAKFDPQGTLFQEQGIAKGATRFLEDQRAFVHAFEQADISTILHELGHIFRRDLTGEDLGIIERWAGVSDGRWATEHEEKFARAWERYLADGQAPTPELEGVFAKLKAWMTEVYRAITGSSIDVNVSPKVKSVFDRMLREAPETAEILPTPARMTPETPVVATQPAQALESAELPTPMPKQAAGGATPPPTRPTAESVPPKPTAQPDRFVDLADSRRLLDERIAQARTEREGATRQAAEFEQQAMALADEWLSRVEEAITQGMPNVTQSQQQIAALRAAKDYAIKLARQLTADASQAGNKFQKDTFFDYAARSNLDELLLKVSPFVTWQTRNIPWYLQEMLRKPALGKTYVAYQEESDRQQREGNLPKRFDRNVELGPLSTWAEMATGRPGASLYGDPLSPVMSVGQQIKEPYSAEGATDAGKAINVARTALGGVSLYPWLQVPLQAAGVFGDQPYGDILPQSRLVRAATGALGNRVDPEAFWKERMTATQGQPAIGSSTIEDYYISKRLAEMVEAGEITQAQALRAMDNPQDERWKQARAAVQREGDMLGALRYFLPMTVKTLTPEEERIRDAQALLPKGEKGEKWTAEQRAQAAPIYAQYPGLGATQAINDSPEKRELLAGQNEYYALGTPAQQAAYEKVQGVHPKDRGKYLTPSEQQLVEALEQQRTVWLSQPENAVFAEFHRADSQAKGALTVEDYLLAKNIPTERRESILAAQKGQANPATKQTLGITSQAGTQTGGAFQVPVSGEVTQYYQLKAQLGEMQDAYYNMGDSRTRGLQEWYMGLDTNRRKTWRSQFPQEYKSLVAFWNQKDQMAAQNPLLGQYLAWRKQNPQVASPTEAFLTSYLSGGKPTTGTKQLRASSSNAQLSASQGIASRAASTAVVRPQTNSSATTWTRFTQRAGAQLVSELEASWTSKTPLSYEAQQYLQVLYRSDSMGTRSFDEYVQKLRSEWQAQRGGKNNSLVFLGTLGTRG